MTSISWSRKSRNRCTTAWEMRTEICETVCAICRKKYWRLSIWSKTCLASDSRQSLEPTKSNHLRHKKLWLIKSKRSETSFSTWTLKRMAASWSRSSVLTSRDSRSSFTRSTRKLLPWQSSISATTPCLRLTLGQARSPMKTMGAPTTQVFNNWNTCFATTMPSLKANIICSTSPSQRWPKFLLPMRSQLPSTGFRFWKTLSWMSSEGSWTSISRCWPSSTETSTRRDTPSMKWTSEWRATRSKSQRKEKRLSQKSGESVTWMFPCSVSLEQSPTQVNKLIERERKKDRMIPSSL